MQLFRSQRQPTTGETLGKGLAAGLQALMQGKIDQINEQREQEVFRNAGYTPEAAQLLTHLRKVAPDAFEKHMQSINPRAGSIDESGQRVSPIMGRPANIAAQDKIDREVNDEMKLLASEYDTVKKIDTLLENPNLNIGFFSVPAMFGKGESAKKAWSPEQTLLDALSSEYHTDKIDKKKRAIRSQYHAAIEGKSKPDISKTLEGNKLITRANMGKVKVVIDKWKRDNPDKAAQMDEMINAFDEARNSFFEQELGYVPNQSRSNNIFQQQSQQQVNQRVSPQVIAERASIMARKQPPQSVARGSTINDPKTGLVFVNDGTQWVAKV